MSGDGRAAARRAFWADLTGASPRWGRTILYAAVVGRLTLIVVGVMVGLAFGEAGYEGFSGTLQTLDALTVVSALVIAPLLEQLLVFLAIAVFHYGMKLPPWPAALLTALGCSALHGFVPASALVFPLFALLAVIQINWARKGSIGAGFGIGVLIHALANGVAVATAWAFGL